MSGYPPPARRVCVGARVTGPGRLPVGLCGRGHAIGAPPGEQKPVFAALDPAVLEQAGLRVEPFGEQDEIVIRRQMGHRPRLAIGVARRCRYGYPQVELFAPLLVDERRTSPNSTLLWLSCPLLVRAVDRLEKEGELDRFEHLAAVDSELRQALEQAHRATARIRRLLLPEPWEQKLARERPREHWVITATGIAGITRADHIKCLHAHLADHLARGANPVGSEVARHLEQGGTAADGSDTCWRFCTPEGASQRWEGSDPAFRAGRNP